ncbi:MAG: fibronectin type III domain-containing protein [Coprothermobacterota bacterium]|nr:fibronectin type III domain-containing protein [Coprothermobacterota bacterium]
MRRIIVGKVTCLVLIIFMISSAFVPGFASGHENNSGFVPEYSSIQSTVQNNSLAAGAGQTLGLKGDGTVWVWGDNGNGQLGLGDTTDRSTPVQVTALGNDITILEAGSYHSLALKGDGTVWAWGYNGNGQLGLGDNTNRYTPVQVTALGDNVVALTANGGHTLALKGDGTVWACGYNGNGQLGLGDTADRSSPVQVLALGNNVKALTTGEYHSLAQKEDSTVWAWGKNDHGQLGLGDTISRLTPVQVTSLGSNVAAMAAGGMHTLSLKDDGTVWAWGWNNNGQLGLGDTTDRLSPVQVTALGSNEVAVAVGWMHTITLKDDGTVWAWGYNGNGQLGLGDNTNRSSPVQVLALGNNVTSLTTGEYHSLASKDDGTVWAWGMNNHGQLGLADTTDRLSPVQVPTWQSPLNPPSGLTATAVSSGQINLFWMDNSGNEESFNLERKTGSGGSWSQIATVGVNVTSYSDTGLASNTPYYYRVCAFRAAGNSVYSNEAFATTSNNTQYNQTLFSGWNMVTVGLQTPLAPAQLFGSSFQAIYRWEPIGGTYFTPQALEPGLGYWVKMAAATTITVQGTPLVSRTLPLSTGWNQVGSPFGSITPWSTVKVAKEGTEYSIMEAKLAGWIIPAYSWNGTSYDVIDYESSAMGVGQGFWIKANTAGMSFLFGNLIPSKASIAAGAFHTLALKGDGTVWAWGSNSDGQLGLGDGATRYYPVQITSLADNVSSLAAGGYHTVALMKDTTVWAWGSNFSGQLGVGDSTSSNSPVQVTSLGSNVVALVAGWGYTLALKSDGTVWAWGENSNGQLGLGDTTHRSIPVQVTSLGSNVTALTAGGWHTLVMKEDGTVWAWGNNGSGQLGLGDTTDRLSPVQVTALGSNVTALAAGGDHTLALKSDGTVWAWGWNSNGQLGLGDKTNRSIPVQVTSLGSNVTALTAGGWHTLAMKEDGTVWTWGWNNLGQLGLGDTTDRSTPTKITSLNGNMTGLTAGGWQTFSVKGDGTVWAWGCNGNGRLGLGDTTNRISPVQVPINLNP